ncbi:MAG: type II toxin-antitoxin system ParD family antitoxin [Hellea sp.]|nr:type II toxin-antitoxin system ParD family antitoxin [Hellea sp.]
MPAKNTKSIALTSQWGRWIDDLVKSGEYQSASEVVRDGLRVLRNGHDREAAELAEIRARLARSLDEADAGNFANGTGENAVRRALKTARAKAGS